MKKFTLILAVVFTVGLVSCQKDDSIQPDAKQEKVQTFDKKDVGGWD